VQNIALYGVDPLGRLERKCFSSASTPLAYRECWRRGYRLVHADPCEELREARIGTKGIGHGLGTEINEAVVALFVRTIKAIESRAVFTEAGVNSGEVKGGNVARMREALEIGESFARAFGVPRESKRMSVQGDHDGMVAREFAP